MTSEANAYARPLFFGGGQLTTCAYNTNGRLTIVNTFDNIKALSFPWNTVLGIALKLSASKEESGIKNISLIFTDESGDHYLSDINGTINLQINEGIGHIALATNIQGVSFAHKGNYFIEILVNNYPLMKHSFVVD